MTLFWSPAHVGLDLSPAARPLTLDLHHPSTETSSFISLFGKISSCVVKITIIVHGRSIFLQKTNKKLGPELGAPSGQQGEQVSLLPPLHREPVNDRPCRHKQLWSKLSCRQDHHCAWTINFLTKDKQKNSDPVLITCAWWSRSCASRLALDSGSSSSLHWNIILYLSSWQDQLFCRQDHHHSVLTINFLDLGLPLSVR